MGWIRYPSKGSLQAVHKADGKEWARTLNYLKFGGTERAHRVANRWLRMCQRWRPTSVAYLLEPTKAKVQDFPRGVWESVNNRGQRAINALWHDGKRRRVKCFYLGRDEVVTEADYRQARKAAIAFRANFLEAQRRGEPFDPEPWKGWRYFIAA